MALQMTGKTAFQEQKFIVLRKFISFCLLFQILHILLQHYQAKRLTNDIKKPIYGIQITILLVVEKV